ncbi:putative LRR receptor-like serine/threonine-protein kinase [Senna tora]|uniref:Putative LRR receptor-like serine/threonine-protein kinase n=1 Tax=Senna tora TaxID=362788 RepID=A0A834XFD8_9FABA|nr:putative LRR receptor-like serine/threonine-protein kinase [Senna tora]
MSRRKVLATSKDEELTYIECSSRTQQNVKTVFDAAIKDMKSMYLKYVQEESISAYVNEFSWDLKYTGGAQMILRVCLDFERGGEALTWHGLRENIYNLPISLLVTHNSLLASLMKSAWSKTNITTDESALLAFKSSITSDPYDFLANWSVSSSPCGWIGVTCNVGHGRVHSLNLSDMGLIGTISPHLGNMSFLVELDLSYNNFQGHLPKELVQLRRLKLLNLSSNEFAGEVPTWIGDLHALQHLNLRNNSLSGIIPLSVSNLSRLETLDWNFNLIEGKIPYEIGRLKSLKILRIAGNKLSGIIPNAISNLSSLELLSLPYNSLSRMSLFLYNSLSLP